MIKQMMVAAVMVSAGGAAYAQAPAAKGKAAPALVKQCEDAWPKAAAGKAVAKDTWACMTYYLTLAYGGPPDAEALTLDPGYGFPQEVKLSSAKLERMIGHVKAVCDPEAAPVESECKRADELFNGIASRRQGLFENTTMESIEGVLATVLKGEKLTREQMHADDPDMSWSPLTLWRLRNAAYARHGYTFKTPDLNTFFYGPREGSTLLPIKQGEGAEVELTENDRANVVLIKSLETHKKK